MPKNVSESIKLYIDRCTKIDVSDRLLYKTEWNAGPNVIVHEPSPTGRRQFPPMCSLQAMGGKCLFSRYYLLFRFFTSVVDPRRIGAILNHYLP